MNVIINSLVSEQKEIESPIYLAQEKGPTHSIFKKISENTMICVEFADDFVYITKYPYVPKDITDDAYVIEPFEEGITEEQFNNVLKTAMEVITND